MTDRVCARPGCGHQALVHDGYGCRGRAGVRDLRRDAEVSCPCPAYRTQAQQEAWEALETAIVLEFGVDFAEGTAYAFTPLGQAAADLLERYP